jgi:hypothetical protein
MTIKQQLKMTSKEIYKALNNYYQPRAYYCVENIYAFCQFYKETDFLVVNNNGYTQDFEVKTSRVDFKNDVKNKPQKHKILETGNITLPYTYFRDKQRFETGELIPCKRPNKFWFVTPENLVTADEVPHYSGLIYVLESGEIKIIKQAPFLHKEKIDLETVLCRKFYYSYLQLKERNKDEEIQRLKRIIKQYEKAQS